MSLRGIDSWSMCLWIKAFTVPSENSAIVTITGQNVVSGDEGIQIYLNPYPSLYIRIGQEAHPIITYNTSAIWHYLCVWRHSATSDLLHTKLDGMIHKRLRFSSGIDMRILLGSSVLLFGSQFYGAIAGLMIWDSFDANVVNLKNRPCELPTAVFLMHLDEALASGATFTLADAGSTYSVNHHLAASLVKPKANEIKPFIAGSHIILMRHESDGRPTSLYSDQFQICELQVSLASFGRRLNAVGVAESDQSKFWSFETHLLYPTADECYSRGEESFHIEFRDTKGGPVVALQFLAAVAEVGSDSTYITISNCVVPRTSALAPGLYYVYCDEFDTDVTSASVEFEMDSSSRICSLAFPAVPRIYSTDVTSTCCGISSQTKTLTYRCMYRWDGGRYTSCNAIETKTVPCAVDYCTDENVVPEWTEWRESSCSATCGTATRTRTRACIGGRLEDCQNISADKEHIQVVECVDNPSCKFEDYACLFECSCYSWSKTLYTVGVVAGWRTCFASGGGFAVGLQSLEEEQLLSAIFGGYFQSPVWTSGRLGFNEGRDLIWFTRFDRYRDTTNPTIVNRIRNPSVSYSEHNLQFDLSAQDYIASYSTIDEASLLCEREADLSYVQLKWSPWVIRNKCDGKATVSVKERFCIEQDEYCFPSRCTRKDLIEIYNLQSTQLINVEYYKSGGLEYEVERSRCCTGSEMPRTVDVSLVDYHYGAQPQSFPCARGYKRSPGSVDLKAQCFQEGDIVKWNLSSAELSCSEQVRCEAPTLHNMYDIIGDSEGSRGYHTSNDIIILKCRPSYEVHGGDGYTVVRCTDSGTWLPDPETLSACAFAGRPSWKYYRESDYCYSYLGFKDSVAGAKSMCTKQFNGSELVSIKSSRENKFIKSLIRETRHAGNLWTSGRKGKNEQYVWGDGSVVTYTDWFFSSQGIQHCISVSDIGWFLENCSFKKEFICYTNQVKQPGGWNSWSDWSACDVSKHRTRTRECTNPKPFCADDMFGCVGDALEDGVCCGDPGFGENANRRGAGATSEGAVVYYTCRQGFTLAGGRDTLDITCQNNGQWTGPPAHCIRISCPSSAVVAGVESTFSSIAIDGQYLYEDVVVYTCNLGFVTDTARSLTHQTVRCEASGTWSTALPVNCYRVKCTDPGLGVNANPPVKLKEMHTDHDSDDYYYFGDIVLYKCWDGFEIGHSTFLKTLCGTLGTWSHPPPKCHKSLCEQPPAMVHSGLVEELPVYNGDTVSIECDRGYVLNQDTHETKQTTKCVKDHVFSPDPVQPCERIDCGEPDNGTLVTRRSGNEYLYQDTVLYLCAEGHVDSTQLTATVTSNCTADGTWHPSTINCERADCGDPGPGSNAVRNVTTDFRYGAMVEYRCYPRYGLSSNINQDRVVLLCNSDSYWNGTINPKCINLPIYYALDVEVVQLDAVILHFIQTPAFDGVQVEYTAEFEGTNVVYNEKFTETVKFNNSKFGDYSRTVSLRPGYRYTLHFTANSTSSVEQPKPTGDALFALKTGQPALHSYLGWSQSMPAVSKVTSYNRMNVTVRDSFGDRNGTVRGYTLVVCETLSWIYSSYYNHRSTKYLLTYSEVNEANAYTVWPCYQVFNICDIFGQSNSCMSTESHFTRNPLYKTANYIVGSETCQNDDSVKYCNGPLKPSARFCIKLRAYTEDDYSETPCSASVVMAPDYSWRTDLILPLVLAIVPFLLLFSVAMIYIYLKWKYPSVERIESKHGLIDLVSSEKEYWQGGAWKGRAGAAVNTWFFKSQQCDYADVKTVTRDEEMVLGVVALVESPDESTFGVEPDSNKNIANSTVMSSLKQQNEKDLQRLFPGSSQRRSSVDSSTSTQTKRKSKHRKKSTSGLEKERKPSSNITLQVTSRDSSSSLKAAHVSQSREHSVSKSRASKKSWSRRSTQQGPQASESTLANRYGSFSGQGVSKAANTGRSTVDDDSLPFDVQEAAPHGSTKTVRAKSIVTTKEKKLVQ